MRLLKYLYLLCLVLSANAFAGAPDTLWTKTYGGTYWDEGKSIQQTKDGGFIIVGWTSSFGAGSGDVYLIKINSSGDTLWTRTYGETNVDLGYSVQQTSDSGFIITGCTLSFGAGDNDVYLIRTNSSGDTLWTRTFGGTKDDDIGYSVQQTFDSGFVIVGEIGYFVTGDWDVYLIRTNSSGDTLWTKTFGGIGNDYGITVQQTKDGGFIITGTTKSFGADSGDGYLIKTSSSGDTLWTKTFGGTDNDYGSAVQQTEDGGFIITGGTESFGAGKWDAYLIRTDSSGDTLWTKTFGGTDNDYGIEVQQTFDSGFIIAGETSSLGTGGTDVYLIRTNSSGDALWTKTFGGVDEDWGNSIQQTEDGGFIITGTTKSFGAGHEDVYLIRLGKETGVEEQQLPVVSPSTTLRVNQNPFSKSTIITYTVGEVSQPRYVSLKIYDIAGKLVKSFPLTTGHSSLTTNVTWNGTDNNATELKTGIYFLTLSTGTSKITKKLTIIK
ncbi:MAG: T9SS type A sorting domain-containing protein [bacterium]|nr:T9SS type A sorting domain-containing protein [bacterium]